MRKGLLVPGAVALVGLAILLGLGTWQIERKAWKESLIATLTQRLNDAPMALPVPADWIRMTPENSEFLRVRLRIEFSDQDDALLYTSGAALRDDVKSPGYFVFTPGLSPDARKVVVNRGYVPDKSYPRASGVQEIVGALRWPGAPPWFIAAHDAAGAVWYARDHLAMARIRGWGAVAPFYIEQEAPVPPGGWPHPAALNVRLRNDHLQYALTWYGLAAVLVLMFAIWTVKRRREGLGATRHSIERGSGISVD
jgi:cytochrome oxidase assembly protein ShyY1